jgi:vacuolar-type H+-ATPase subunit H
MIDENFYQKRVDELKKSLKSKTVFINESFSGGLFRTSAKPYLKELSIYHLLRGLEIDTDSETYTKLSGNLPVAKDLFNESTAEDTTADRIVEEQLNYVKEAVKKAEKDIVEKVSEFLKENKQDIKKLVSNVRSLKDQNILEIFFKALTANIKGNQTGLKDTVYQEVDDMGLRKIEPESFALDSFLWLKETDIDSTIEKNIMGMNPIVRISMLLEIVLKSMNIDGLKFISYNNNPYDYLESIVGSISTSADLKNKIISSKIKDFKEFLNSICKEIVEEQYGLLGAEYKKNITIPSLQSLFVSMITVMVLKAIANSVTEESQPAETTEEKKIFLSEKVQSKAKGIFDSYGELEKLGFFESEKIFYEKKKFSKIEQDMIVALKQLFSDMGLLPKSSSYINRGTFDADILGEAVKTFQSKIEINGQGLKADGRIGKNTRLSISTFVEDLKARMEGKTEGTGTKGAKSNTENVGIRGVDTTGGNKA